MIKRIVKDLLILFLVSGCVDREKSLFPGMDDVIDIRCQHVSDSTFVFESLPEHQLLQELTLISGKGSAVDPILYELTISNNNDQDWKGIIRIGIKSSEDSARFYLPGFMYGTNQGHVPYNAQLIKQFPRLRKGEIAPPYSPFWYARSDQLSHPVAIMHSGANLFGISADPVFDSGQYNGFYCSIEEKATIGFTLGYCESPGLYVNPWEYIPYSGVEKGTIKIEPGKSIQLRFKVYLFEAAHAVDLGVILKNVYREYHEPPRKSSTVESALLDITQAISKDAYSRQNQTYALTMKKPETAIPGSNYYGGLRFALNNQEEDSYDYNLEGLISWTNGTVIAAPMLMASYRLDKPHLRNDALEVIHEIIQGSINPKTLIPYCTRINGKWTNQGWWTQWVESEGVSANHSSYVIGQALYYLIKAYDIEKKQGEVEHQYWLVYVEQVLDRLTESQRNDGAFPRFWSEVDGTGSEYDAFSGCWVAAAMAYYTFVTGNDKFLESALFAENYYHLWVQEMECIKTPLDVADAPDSEGILAYIRLTKILDQITGDEKQLQHLQEGLDYSFSYKFCYNVPISSPPLDQLRWSSSGGDITSVCNAVIHCMSNTILDEILYCYLETGDTYYYDRLRDTYYWGLQAYNRQDNEFFFGKKGWSTEYFCQSNRYVLDIRLVDGIRSNIWFAYHPWATASILEGLCGETWDIDMK